MAVSAEFVRDLVLKISSLGADVWLDGGWGVDALLMNETRPHDDVDIVVQQRHLQSVTKVLDALGFFSVTTDDAKSWNFVLSDDKGQKVDFHVIVFDAHGNGIYGPPQFGKFYPANAFSGRGMVANTPVKCVSAAFQIAGRAGYNLRDKDLHDLRMLRTIS